MTVAAVKQIAPLADVYELHPQTKYLFVLPLGSDTKAFRDALSGLAAKGSAIVTLRDPERLLIRTHEEG